VSDARPSASVGALVTEMAAVLRASFADAATAEARELLAALHDRPRHWALSESHSPIAAEHRVPALHAARQRARGAPLQYAAGLASFRHLTLAVDERVLIPRPETELLVDIVLERLGDRVGGTAIDVGTGSGAIALALASEAQLDQVIGTDVSLDALTVARENAVRCRSALRAVVDFRHGSLLGPVSERGVRAVVSNPPYIAYDEAASLPAGVRDWEPAVALFSGADGLATTARLVREAACVLEPRGILALEVDVRRAGSVADLIASHGAYDDIRVILDLTGRERFVVARRLEEQG